MTNVAPEPPPAPTASPAASRSSGLWVGVLLVLSGGAWLLSATGVVDLGLEAGIGLVLIGIGAVVALDAGHSHGLLVTLAVILSLAGAVTTWFDADLLSGGVGDRVETPVSAADASGLYELGMGKLTIDLTALQGPQNGVIPVRAEVGIGQLYVTVSVDAEVAVDAHVAVGNVHVAGTDTGGFDVDEQMTLPGAGQAIAIDATVGIGEVRIVRAP